MKLLQNDVRNYDQPHRGPGHNGNGKKLSGSDRKLSKSERKLPNGDKKILSSTADRKTDTKPLKAGRRLTVDSNSSGACSPSQAKIPSPSYVLADSEHDRPATRLGSPSYMTMSKSTGALLPSIPQPDYDDPKDVVTTTADDSVNRLALALIFPNPII